MPTSGWASSSSRSRSARRRGWGRPIACRAERDRLEELAQPLVGIGREGALEAAIHRPARLALTVHAVAVHQILREEQDIAVGNVDEFQLRLDRLIEFFGRAELRHAIVVARMRGGG